MYFIGLTKRLSCDMSSVCTVSVLAVAELE